MSSDGTGWRDRAQYKFDMFMARGGRSIFVILALAFAAVLLLVVAARSIVLAIFPDSAAMPGSGFFRSLYVVFLQMSEPGSMSLEIDSPFWAQAVSVFAGLSGIVLLSALIAFITTALNERLASLRKGHSRVVERGHTLILGWHDQAVLEVVRELVTAHEGRGDAAVVILAERDKEYMDDFLRLNLPDRGTTRIVTRSGNPASTVSLDLVQIGEARSAVVLSGALDTDFEEEQAATDARVMKRLLAAVTSRPSDRPINIVTELMDPRLKEMAQTISPDQITALNSSEILAKIFVQTSRSAGLSVVYNELLSFRGAEIYFHRADWGGAAFGSLSFRMVEAIAIGYRSEGEVILNPSPDRPMEPGDDLIVVAPNKAAIRLREKPVVDVRPVSLPAVWAQLSVERKLIVGWTPKCPTILGEYQDYVVPGSRIDIMPRVVDHECVAEELARLSASLPNLELSIIDDNPMDPLTWNTVDPEEYDNVLILGQPDDMHDMKLIDTETIMILIMLRERVRSVETGDPVTKLITELVESENAALVTQTGVHDYVVSPRFTSMLLAQISEEQGLSLVYDRLFAEDGSEIYLKSPELYFGELPATVRFADLMAVAQARGEVCLGVKVKESELDPSLNFGITLNPRKGTEFTLTERDRLVVLAEDQT